MASQPGIAFPSAQVLDILSCYNFADGIPAPKYDNPYMPAKPLPQMRPVQGIPEWQKVELTFLLTNDKFNTYCIDCFKNKATHFNVTFGTFICE